MKLKLLGVMSLSLIMIGCSNANSIEKESSNLIKIDDIAFNIGDNPTEELLNKFLVCYSSKESFNEDLNTIFVTTEQKNKYLETYSSNIYNKEVTEEEYTNYINGYKNNTDKLIFGGNFGYDGNEHLSMTLINNTNNEATIYDTTITSMLVTSDSLNIKVDDYYVTQNINEMDMSEFSLETKDGTTKYYKDEKNIRLTITTINNIIVELNISKLERK